MYNNMECKCPHHFLVKVLAFLIWVAGALFFWSSWGERMFFGFDYDYYAWAVVVLVLLAVSSKFCGCCGMGMKMGGGMCKHDTDCKCGDCDRCR